MKDSLDLTGQQIEELEKLDSYIVDYSDIPRRTDFSKAIIKYSESNTEKK